MSHAVRHVTWGAVALVAACLLTLAAPGPRAASAAPPGGWEYRLASWSEEDTTAVLRQVTGATELADPVQLAQALERQGPLLDDPKILAAVDARLQVKLDQLGREGWEAFWVREVIALAGGAPFRTVTLMLKRPRAG